MRVQIVPATAVLLAIVCTSLFLNTSAPAQTHINMGNAMALRPGDAQTMAERMTHLEATVAALQAQLAADEKKLQETGATATQAQMGVGFINSGFGKQIENLKARQDSVDVNMNNTNGVIAGIDQKVAVLSDHFEHHTHQYLHFSLKLDPDNNTVTSTNYAKTATWGPNY
jgi:peptidoglycan hydrolase CwlO-like protein